ncbi:hypothetical protein [Shewanella sp. CG_4_10_14_0_8_um_filter_42_13]|uniref:hypothetical protein n=1 Tax=Shewanella sp. CG_4_10_14_0_8_um_filter_42_13 TaxID=1975534 RepID=UPI000CC6EBF0|nr:hypothetical protein [Shewanella sp. CG_4_10_14_0_8_um_filter_42_13]PIY67105.1 MAG: hypothetical protein COY92_07195 [Shewanella sp. CG_4_10_14_0_8_um_filter_42_13]
MYHDDTQYFGEDYAKCPDSTAVTFIIPRTHGKASFFQQFVKRKPTYFDRVPANTHLAKSTVFKRMRDYTRKQ